MGKLGQAAELGIQLSVEDARGAIDRGRVVRIRRARDQRFTNGRRRAPVDRRVFAGGLGRI